MNRAASRASIEPFIRDYGVDPAEFEREPEAFEHFNAFFYRNLKPESRPVVEAADAIAFPADGRHFLIPRAETGAGFFLKGERFELERLLEGMPGAERFRDGAVVLSRLCPVDYHRFHFPVGGDYVPHGKRGRRLYSVSPVALFRRPSILWTNRRQLSVIERGADPPVAMVEVGATFVGAILNTAAAGPVRRGQEKGYFAFGASSVITVFPPATVEFAEDLRRVSGQGLELYARFGDRLGTWRG